MLTKDKTKDLIGKTLKRYDSDVVAPKIQSSIQEHNEIMASQSAPGHMSAADKAKLDGIEAGANRYVHPTGDGNLHVPATGTSNNGKVLKAGATAGSLQWADINWADVKGKPSEFTPSAHTHEITEVTGLQSALDAKESVANVTSKVAAGVQEAKTYADTKSADALKSAKAYADEKVAGLVDSAPETLDTLKELSAALGDDPNFATTVATQIGQKADKAHKHEIADVNGLEEALEAAADKAHTHNASDIVTDAEHQFATEAQKTQWDENTVYTNEMAMVSPLGGLSAGQTFDNMPINELLTKLLYPYVQPTISLSASPNGGAYEKGAKVSTVALTANVGKKSEKITEVKFFDGNAEIHNAEVNANGGAHSFTVSTEFGVNKTFKATVNDGKKTVTSNQISFNFYYPAYIGALDASAEIPTQEQIKGLTKKVQSAGNLTYSYTVDTKRMVVATPPNWEIRKILDPNSFDVTSSFKKHIVSVTGLDGTAQNYNVYVSEPTTQTNFAMKFNVN